MANSGPTVRAILRDATARLAAAGVDSAMLDSRLLLGHVLDRDTAWMIANADASVAGGHRAAVETLLARREAREPMAQILGFREFWSLPFETGPDVLTPRPDSETLVEAVLNVEPDRVRGMRVLDLGTGSGCLLLSLLSEFPNARGLGVDISPAAIAVARRNAERLGLSARAEWLASDWSQGVDGWFDLIVSNPPYIESGAIAGLEPEVRDHEPRGALDGGPDGLDPYRDLLSRAAGWMTDAATLFLEHGDGQSDAVAAIAREHDFGVRGVRADLAGRKRVVILER